MSDARLHMHQLLRYAKGASADSPMQAGYPNFFYFTRSDRRDASRVQLEAGISSPVAVRRSGQRVTPVVMIRSNPHRAGSTNTPWEDYFDTDRGHILYYGDSRAGDRVDAPSKDGNQLLIQQHRLHTSISREERLTAAPLVFFRGIQHDKRAKGFLRFEGYGLIERVEKVTQVDVRLGVSFTNFRYDFLVMSLKDEGEVFSWDWINARRDARVTLEASLQLAPRAWQRWVADGSNSLQLVRRSVAAQLVTPSRDQLPDSGSREAKILQAVYAFYSDAHGAKKRFEALAELVAEHLLMANGARYSRGWITPGSRDGGADFVGRLDVGSGFSTSRLVVLGQAKCQARAVSGEDIARTVARLRRGWLGVFVTTSHFSEPTQVEVYDDEYPIVLVPGRRLAETVSQLMAARGHQDVGQFLKEVDSTYDSRIQVRNPSEILFQL